MDIEPFLPINTKEKVDEIINLILVRQEPQSVYSDILMCIQKLKIQLYFKEKFNNIKPQQVHQKESVIDNTLIQDKKKLSYKEAYREALLKELKLGAKISNKKVSTKSISPIVENKDKISENKHTLTTINNNINTFFFKGMTIKKLSEFIDMPLKTLLSIIKQKKESSISLIDDNYSLTKQDTELLSDFLQNAYSCKIRKDKKEDILEKKITNAEYYRKKMEDRFRPSLGKEGNYRKLIYINTKT